MRSLLFILALSMALFSCKKDSKLCDDTQPLQNRIEGTWVLTEVFNPWTNESLPPTTEQEQTWIFADSLTTITFYDTSVVAYQTTNDELVINGDKLEIDLNCNTFVTDATPVDGPRNTYSRVLAE